MSVWTTVSEKGKFTLVLHSSPVLSLTSPKPSCALAPKFCEGCALVATNKLFLSVWLEWVPVTCKLTVPKILNLARKSASSVLVSRRSK